MGLDITHEIVTEGGRNGPYRHVDVADGIVKVLAEPAKYIKPRGEILRMFELARTVDEYEKLFEEKRS